MVTEKKRSSAFGYLLGVLVNACKQADLAPVVGQMQRNIGKCGEFSQVF